MFLWPRREDFNETEERLRGRVRLRGPTVKAERQSEAEGSHRKKQRVHTSNTEHRTPNTANLRDVIEYLKQIGFNAEAIDNKMMMCAAGTLNPWMVYGRIILTYADDPNPNPNRNPSFVVCNAQSFHSRKYTSSLYVLCRKKTGYTNMEWCAASFLKLLTNYTNVVIQWDVTQSPTSAKTGHALLCVLTQTNDRTDLCVYDPDPLHNPNVGFVGVIIREWELLFAKGNIKVCTSTGLQRLLDVKNKTAKSKTGPWATGLCTCVCYLMLFVMLRFLWFDLNLVSDLVQQAFETEISEKIWDDNGMTYTGAQAQEAKRAKLSACGQYLVQIVYGAICTHKTDTLLRRLAVRGSQQGPCKVRLDGCACPKTSGTHSIMCDDHYSLLMSRLVLDQRHCRMESVARWPAWKTPDCQFIQPPRVQSEPIPSIDVVDDITTPPFWLPEQVDVVITPYS
jgi:hypothetical protein